MSKRYVCPYCGKPLKHDEAFTHVQYHCTQKPKR